MSEVVVYDAAREENRDYGGAWIRGRHLGLTFGVALSMLVFLGFGTPSAYAAPITINCGPGSMVPNDDSSTAAIPLGFDVSFFGNEYSSVFVNTNGNVTFDAPLSTYTPFDLSTTDKVIVAPYFADVDIRSTNGGAVTYGTMTYEGHDAFCVEWHDVGYYDQHEDLKNTFALVIVERNDVLPGDFDLVFLYEQIKWETGDVSGGNGGFGGTSARVGYANGSGESQTFFELNGSAIPGSFLDSGPDALIGQGSEGILQYPIRSGLPKNDSRNVPTPWSLESDWWDWPDEDRDGIPDNWEADGVWVDDVFMDLPAFGADPRHMDLFIQVDFAPGHSLDLQVFEHLIESFDEAPMSNPDGTTGITLHIDGGPWIPMDGAGAVLWESFSRSSIVSMVGVTYPFEDSFEANVRTIAQQGFIDSPRAGGRGVPQLFKSFVDVPGFSPGTIGMAYVLGNYGAVSLPDATVNAMLNSIEYREFWRTSAGNAVRATNLMHEIGHNIGLRHHGSTVLPESDPNYRSVMSYAYNVTGPDGKIDYSRESTVNLDWTLSPIEGDPPFGKITFVSGQHGEDGAAFYDIGDGLSGVDGPLPTEPTVDEMIDSMVESSVDAFIEQFPISGTFEDDDDSIFEADIEWMAAEGITKGCNPPTNDRFCPDNKVTRGQMAAFLVRGLGLTDRLDNPFVDDNSSIFEADIEKLAAAGITKGCNPPANDRFCPDAKVTREQMAAFLVRALGFTDNGGGDLFVDDDSSIFEADIDRLGTAGVTKGCNPPTNDRFCPDNKVTRGQMAAFLHRALG